jgi:hypothetical protein
MEIRLGETVICEVVKQPVLGGLTYAIIEPDSKSRIYASKGYAAQDVARLTRLAVMKWLQEDETVGAHG